VLGPIALVLLLFACLQLWLGLHPLRRVVRELNAVQTGRTARMSRQFPVELAPLVDSINRLLDRQDTLIRKARDRAGALAHGLKTPLTVLNGEVRRLQQAGEREAAARVDEQLGLIRVHVDREVARARTSGASVGGGAYTAVDATVARLVRLMQHLPRGEEIVWDARVPPDLAVEMDPHDFGEVLGNLLYNARKWARHRVTVSAVPAGLKARIVVEDDGPGLPGAAPATRLERGLTGRVEAGSSGLGLGIVEDVLSEYGTRPEIDGNGRFRISFEVLLCREPLKSARVPRAGDGPSGRAAASLGRRGQPA
jgi:signal transduction histidine kinase